MSGKGKCDQNAIVDIKFEENLTWVSCSKMIIEIIKYLAYQKQQIPYPFEQLKLLVTKRKTGTGAGSTISKSLHSGRYHRKATEAVEALENIFQNIEAEFMISGQFGIGGIEEVAVLFGATPVTPKDVFRIQIPEIKNNFDFESPKPPSRRMMVHLLRCLLESESLHSIVSQPLTTTNTFVFLKIKSDCSRASEDFVNKSWFLPRENFKLPQKGRQVVLRIEYASKELLQLEVESPLARPLVSNSDSESTPLKDENLSDDLRFPFKKMENLRQQGECGSVKVIKIPGFKLPNHLVFKEPKPVQQDPASSKDKNSYVGMQCLAGNVSGSVQRLSDDFDKLSFNPCLEKSKSDLASIEWFEARAHIRGFKDCVVNGNSAITS